MSQNRIRLRMLAIARGKYKPKGTEPKFWFTSMRSLAEVLSDENRALLRLIQEEQLGTRLATYLLAGGAK